MKTFLQPSSFPKEKLKLLKTSTPKPAKKILNSKINFIDQIERLKDRNTNMSMNQLLTEDIISEEGSMVIFEDKGNLEKIIKPKSESLKCCEIMDDKNTLDSTNESISKLFYTRPDVISKIERRSISPTSSFNSSLNDSMLSLTPERLLLKYDLEFRDAISSDLNILMNKQIIDSCKLTIDESIDSNDFNEFVGLYTELVAWLNRTLQLFSSNPICLSERYANQSCGEEMLQKLTSRENFEYHADYMAQVHPTLVEDIQMKKQEVDLLWKRLQEIMNPSKTITHLLIFRDVEVDIQNLNNWIYQMKQQMDFISLEIKNKNSSNKIKEIISSMILDLDCQFKCLTSITNVCKRMIGIEGLHQQNFVNFHNDIPHLQQKCQSFYLQLLEWQLRLDVDQFVPHNFDLDNITEESDNSYDSFYDENIDHNQLINKMAALDRKISSSAPSLNDPPSTPLNIKSGNITELEDYLTDYTELGGGLLRRANVVKDLTNIVQYNSLPSNKAIYKSTDSLKDVEINNIVEEDLKNLEKFEICCVGPYQDVGYSTGSKSPPSTENCSDSSGIIVGKEKYLKNEDLPDNFSNQIMNDAINFCGNNAISNNKSMSGRSFTLMRIGGDIDVNKYISNDSAPIFENLKVNSLGRKKKKRRKIKSGSLDELNGLNNSPKFMRRCFSDNCHIAIKTSSLRKRDYNSLYNNDVEFLPIYKIRRTLFKELDFEVHIDDFELSDNETCRSLDSSNEFISSNNLHLLTSFELQERQQRLNNVLSSDSEEEADIDNIIRQSSIALHLVFNSLNNCTNEINYREVKATCDSYIFCLTELLQVYANRKHYHISTLKEMKLRWNLLRKNTMKSEIKNMAKYVQQIDRDISILAPLNLDDLQRIDDILQDRKDNLNACISKLDELEKNEEFRNDIVLYKELNSNRIDMWNLTNKLDIMSKSILNSKEIVSKFDLIFNEIRQLDEDIHGNEISLINAFKLLDEEELKLQTLLELYGHLSNLLPYTSLSSLRIQLELAKNLINLARSNSYQFKLHFKVSKDKEEFSIPIIPISPIDPDIMIIDSENKESSIITVNEQHFGWKQNIVEKVETNNTENKDKIHGCNQNDGDLDLDNNQLNRENLDFNINIWNKNQFSDSNNIEIVDFYVLNSDTIKVDKLNNSLHNKHIPKQILEQNMSKSYGKNIFTNIEYIDVEISQEKRNGYYNSESLVKSPMIPKIIDVEYKDETFVNTDNYKTSFRKMNNNFLKKKKVPTATLR